MECPCKECLKLAICISLKRPFVESKSITSNKTFVFYIGLARNCESLIKYLDLPYIPDNTVYEEFKRIFKL